MKKEFNVLCYGDSNTWGFVAGSINYETYYMERYPKTIRWTGLLQDYLGKDFHVVEEGLNGRTTNADSIITPDRSGKTYLPPCLFSHAPLDLVILCLGVNDFKIEFNRTADDVRNGLVELIDIIQATTFGANMRSAPPILLVNNCLLSNELYQGMDGDFIFKGAICKGSQLSKLLPKLASDKHCYYLDTTDILFSELDGLHYDEEGHKQFAQKIFPKIKDIFDMNSTDNLDKVF